MERLATGVPQLDHILGGGLPANTLCIVMGGPGSGKTILAEQLAFANATPDRPALYLTTFSEPLAKFLTFLQEYTFADPARVGVDVLYHNLGEQLLGHPERLADTVAELVQRHRPKILIIDSFKAIADLMPDTATWRRQLYELAGFLSAYSTTALWVGEYTSEMIPRLPEFAVVDGVLELRREQRGARDFRFLRVVKLRGSAFLDGDHAMQLRRDGLKLFPRLVMPSVGPDYHPVESRLKSGVPGLDELIESGWLSGTMTLVRGPSGSGKTLLSLQFLLEGLQSGEPALLVNFEENPVQIARVMRSVGWDPATSLGPGRVDVYFCSPVELQIDTIVGELFARIESQGVRRLAIDGVGDLAVSADDPIRIRDYLYTLAQRLATANVTSVFTVQSALEEAPGEGTLDLSYLADNVVQLEMTLGEELTRSVRVLKSRGSRHDGRRRPLGIGPRGLVVG